MRFLGKTVVITGAGSGLGEACALLFAREGATVIASDIDEENGKRVAASGAGDIRFKRCDVCDVSEIKALMDFAAAETGGIDVLFNNAGAIGAPEKIHEMEPEAWDSVMHLLLRSVAFGIRYAAPHMMNRHNASIVNVSSIAGEGPGYAPSLYSIAKAGVLQITKVAAADLAPFGIRVNALQPGYINTNIIAAALEVEGEQRDAVNAIIAQVTSNTQPVKRGGQVSDIAEAVAYFASEAGSFINGASLLVDGGITLGPREGWDPEAPTRFQVLEALAEQTAN